MAQNENEDNNKRQTRSQSHSSSHLSRPSTPSKSSIPSILLSQFQEYDHSNNGFLNWDEFCAMCSDKNINEDERDTYWKELGGENQNSTISYQQKQQHHSDDEHMREAHRLVRSSTAKSEFSVSVTTLFERGPLKVFERFDMEQNGTLNVSQFVQMVNALYPTPTSDDHKDQDEDDKVIKDTFVQVDCDKSDRLDYRDGVHDLEAELDRFGENKPNKTEFLNLCVEVFGNKNEFNVMNELTNANPIGEVRTCINTFAEHVESGGKHQYRFAKLTVEQLAQWIEKHGIPSIVKIEELQREYDTLLRHKSKVDSDLVRKHDEQVLTKRFLDETGEDKAKLENDLKQCQYTKRMLQTRCDNVCEQLEVVQNQLNKTKDDLKIAKKAQKKMRSYEDEIEELRAQRESLQNQLELYCERHQNTKTTVDRLEKERQLLEIDNMNQNQAPSMGATTHHLKPAHPESDSDEFERNDYEESERFTHTRRYSDESDTNIGSIMSTDGHHQRVPSTVGLSDRDEPLFNMYPASDHYVEPMMDTAQLQEQIASQLKQCFQDQAQQIKQLLQAAHQPNELQKNTMQTMVDIKKNCKLTELEIAKQSDNLKEHLQQQTHQIKADLNTFQRNMTEQLSQSMHQPNEAKDESTVADTVPQVNQTIPPLTREEWQDLQNKTNQTMQTMADIKKNWKQTAKQNDNLKAQLEEQTQQIKGDLNELQQHMKSQLLQSMHQPNEAKDESSDLDIVHKVKQNTPPFTTDEWRDLQNKTIQTMEDIKKNYKQTELEISKQNDNLKEHFRQQTQQTQQIKGDLNEFQQHMKAQLLQSMHQPNEAKDESTVADIVQNTPPVTTDELRDLQDKTNQTMQTIVKIKNDWKQTESEIVKQNDNLKKEFETNAQKIRRFVKQIQTQISEYETLKEKEDNYLKQITSLKQKLEDNSMQNGQWEKMEHAIDGLRSQLNAHDKSFAKIQNSLGVCAHSSTSAVAKQNDNLKEHFQQQTQQTQQIKADLTEFQRNLAEQLPQPTHQPNEAKDESTVADIVPLTREEWQDLQRKINQTMQTIAEIKSCAPTELDMAKQDENLKEHFQKQTQQIKANLNEVERNMTQQLLQSMPQPNDTKDELAGEKWLQLQNNIKQTMQTMADIKKNWKQTDSEIAKQNDNLKKHLEEQTQQIKADLTEFQQHMRSQLLQSMHQPNEAKDESSDLDIVHKVKQNTPHFTTDEWRDLQDKTNQTIQTMEDIKKNCKQTELDIAKQNDNLKEHFQQQTQQTQQIKADLTEFQQHMKSQLLQSMHQPNEAKDESTVADIVQNTPPVTTDEWQWEKMEHAIDGLRLQLNEIQNSLGVCTHISTSAIESAQDKIQMTQLHAETESATKFSSLGYNLYSMKKQLHDALDVLNTLKTTLPQVIAKTVKAAQIHEEEDEDEDDDDDIKHCTKDSTLKVLESQIGKEMTIVLQSQLIDDAIHKSKQELMDYMDLKFEHKQQSELLAKECKEEEEYTNAQRLDDAEQGQRKDALLAQFIESNSQVLDATSDIKKETERLMSLLRTLVGLDVAQTMRFANDQNETLIKKIQTRMDDISARIAQQGRVTKEQIQARMDAVCAQITEQKEANRVNDRFNDSIKSHTKLLQQMFAESDETIKTELEHSSQSWFHQLRKYQDSTNRNFDELKKDVKVTNQTNHFGDEYTTKMMAKIRANQSSCWRDTGCGLFAAMAANFFFVILFFAHKGHYA